MATITENEYNSRKQELLDKVAQLERLEYYLTSNADTMTSEHYSSHLIDKLGDFWNATHDEIYALKKELHYLEGEWSRRNWTHQDFMEYELMINNID